MTSTTLQQPTIQRIELDNGFKLNSLTPYIATITKGDIRQTSYFGFNSKSKATTFGKALLNQKKATEMVVRPSERLKTTYEVKAWGIQTEFLIHLYNQFPDELPGKL